MNKKLVVSSLAICMGAGLVGSVSGTVAWYQYSTKTAINMMGTSIGVSKTLQIGIGGDGTPTTDLTTYPTRTEYKGGLSIDDVKAYLESTTRGNENGTGETLSPVTQGAFAKDGVMDVTKFVGNPIAGVTDMSKWIKAEGDEFVVLPLWIRAVETDKDGEHYVARKIGMSDVSIDNKSVTGKQDITDAVRVHVNCGDNNLLLANVSETATYGKMDLDGIPGNDKTAGKYEWEESEEIIYGVENSKQESYNVKTAVKGGDLLVDDEYRNAGNSLTDNKEAYKGGYTLGTTTANSEKGINVNLVIWLEGWQELTKPEVSDKKVWDADAYIGSQFYLGITFCNDIQ